MRAIGGYLELERNQGQEYHTSALRFNTVRNSIAYIIKKRAYTKIYVPYYICHSVTDKLKMENIEYTFYHIDKNLLPDIEDNIGMNEAVLVVNYFGQLSNDVINKLKIKYGNIIVDNTQSFFQEADADVDTVYTCRKYFGVADGAYLTTSLQCEDYKQLMYDCSSKRMGHLLGRYEGAPEEYYAEFKTNDELLAELPIMKMSLLTQNILKGIDYDTVKEKRKNNFTVLHSGLENNNLLSIQNYAGYFMYPLLCENGAELKKNLIKERVFVPTLWPNVLNLGVGTWEYNLANNLVLLPIDQRYSIKEMEYILDVINA